MADATSSQIGKLPSPDYASPEEDQTLSLPNVIHYDTWRKASLTRDELPLPPAHLLLPDDDDETFPEPPPDYDGEVRDNQDFPGLIPPSKLPNPVLESRDRVQLNKDIKFNVKHGINVLNTKPELKKELERRKLDRQKKEMVEKQRQNRNSFEQKMDIQRERLHSSENAEKILEEEANESELMRACNKIKGKSQVQQ